MTHPAALIEALIIDDNAKNVAVLERLLLYEGISSRTLTNPLQLPAILEEVATVRVIFIDLEMPGMSGYDVLQHIKADARFAQVPLVAYTVHTSEIKNAHHHGFDSFLGKPLDSDKFPQQLARILSGEPVWETQ